MNNIFDKIHDTIIEWFQKEAVRRWTIEILVSIIVGMMAGCITYNVLNKDDEGLTVSKELAAAASSEETVSTDENTEDETSEDTDTSDVEEDYSDVVITVVDPSAYANGLEDWSTDEIEAAVSERSEYLNDNEYWTAVSDYWENVRGVTDNTRFCTYLFDTDSTVYASSDFDDVPAEVIHVAKNEIYARHGYSFRDPEIMNYFMGQVWYTPSVMPTDFSEEIFTETEVKNLDLLNSIDTM